MLPALGPPTSWSPKVASMSESARALRTSPSREPSESGLPSPSASLGTMVVRWASTAAPSRSTPSVTRVPGGIVVSRARSWLKSVTCVVGPPSGAIEVRTSPTWISVEVCSSARPSTWSTMRVARPVSMRAATTAASWELVIWAWLTCSTSWALIDSGHTVLRSTTVLSSSNQARMTSRVVTGKPGQPRTETVVIRRAPSAG